MAGVEGGAADMRILNADCREAMREIAENSVDAVVTDPPYGLSFMGKDWDHGVPGEPFWREVLRVLKPGGHLLAFGGSRTYHRLTCAIEDAGFEIRDCIMWLYGSGFPKSHNGEWGGTALKPAHEPIVMARKPLEGTVAANVLKWGTGAVNIDGCRVPGVKPKMEAIESDSRNNPILHTKSATSTGEYSTEGRWPANVIHDGSDEVLASFAQFGDKPGCKSPSNARPEGAILGGARSQGAIYADKGSAARFFYCAKASRSERNAGLDQFPDRPGGMVSNTSGQHITRRDGGAPGPTKNNHPTVKPVALMRYLCRLVTPQGGTILDPFMGSGSTGCASVLEGFDFTGIELNEEYATIATARIEQAKSLRDEQVDMFEAAP